MESFRPIFDVEHALAHLRAADPKLVPVIEAVGAYTLQPQAHGFGTLVQAIISQQISVKAAASIGDRLRQYVGELTPPRLLELSPDTLRGLGLSYQKARYMLDLAAKVQDGMVDLAHIEQLPDEEVITQLVQVKGIGRWTAEMYLIFALARPDVLPVDDLGLRQGVQRLYQLPELPVAATVRAIAEPWRPFRSVATWYLWRNLSLASRVGTD